MLVDEVEKEDRVVNEGKNEGFNKEQPANLKTARVEVGGSHP